MSILVRTYSVVDNLETYLRVSICYYKDYMRYNAEGQQDRASVSLLYSNEYKTMAMRYGINECHRIIEELEIPDGWKIE
jgi:hypothetical protein